MSYSWQSLQRDLKYTASWELQHPEGTQGETVTPLWVMNYTASWTHLVEYCVERSRNPSLRTRYQLPREKWVELNIALSDNFPDEAAEPEDIEGLALRTQLKNDYTASLTEFKSVIQAAENLSGPDEVMTWRNNMLDKPVTLEPLESEWQQQKEELDKL